MFLWHSSLYVASGHEKRRSIAKDFSLKFREKIPVFFPQLFFFHEAFVCSVRAMFSRLFFLTVFVFSTIFNVYQFFPVLLDFPAGPGSPNQKPVEFFLHLASQEEFPHQKNKRPKVMWLRCGVSTFPWACCMAASGCCGSCRSGGAGRPMAGGWRRACRSMAVPPYLAQRAGALFALVVGRCWSIMANRSRGRECAPGPSLVCWEKVLCIVCIGDCNVDMGECREINQN